jgi:hypothetical protein
MKASATMSQTGPNYSFLRWKSHGYTIATDRCRTVPFTDPPCQKQLVSLKGSHTIPALACGERVAVARRAAFQKSEQVAPPAPAGVPVRTTAPVHSTGPVADIRTLCTIREFFSGSHQLVQVRTTTGRIKPPSCTATGFA